MEWSVSTLSTTESPESALNEKENFFSALNNCFCVSEVCKPETFPGFLRKQN